MIHRVTETGSTNTDLLVLAREGAPEGTWVWADRQQGGRGRQGRSWLSPEGNLFASSIVRIRADDPPAPTLFMVAAVAIHEVASVFAPGVRIKWPNDVIFGESKLAGILLEREGDAVVAGFGINLAVRPEGLDRPAIALSELTDSAPDPETFLNLLVEALSLGLDHWRRSGLVSLRQAWLDRAHPVGTALQTSEGEGLFEGLDPDGALKLRLADGTCRVIHAGDIFLLKGKGNDASRN